MPTIGIVLLEILYLVLAACEASSKSIFNVRFPCDEAPLLGFTGCLHVQCL